jgi:nucleoside-triphosphatase THEP1
MILILSGPSGSGKTSACAIIARLAVESGLITGGVLCRALFVDGRKAGIEALDLAIKRDERGTTLALARPEATRPEATRPDSRGTASKPPGGVPPFDASDPRVIRYGMWDFDASAMAAADSSAANFLAEASLGSRLGLERYMAIVDEIGPLELDKGVGMVRTLAAIDELALAAEPGVVGSDPEGARRLCVLVNARPDIAIRLAARWGEPARMDISGMPFAKAAETVLAAFGLGQEG